MILNRDIKIEKPGLEISGKPLVAAKEKEHSSHDDISIRELSKDLQGKVLLTKGLKSGDYINWGNEYAVYAMGDNYVTKLRHTCEGDFHEEGICEYGSIDEVKKALAKKAKIYLDINKHFKKFMKPYLAVCINQEDNGKFRIYYIQKKLTLIDSEPRNLGQDLFNKVCNFVVDFYQSVSELTKKIPIRGLSIPEINTWNLGIDGAEIKLFDFSKGKSLKDFVGQRGDIHDFMGSSDKLDDLNRLHEELRRSSHEETMRHLKEKRKSMD